MGRPDKKGNKTFGMLLKGAVRAVDRPAWRQGAADTAAAGAVPGAALPCRRCPEQQKRGVPLPKEERRPAWFWAGNAQNYLFLLGTSRALPPM